MLSHCLRTVEGVSVPMPWGQRPPLPACCCFTLFSSPGLVIAHILQVAVLWGWLPLLFLLLLLLFFLVPRELRGLGPQLFLVCSQALGPLELPAHQRGRTGQPPRGPPCCTR